MNQKTSSSHRKNQHDNFTSLKGGKFYSTRCRQHQPQRNKKKSNKQETQLCYIMNFCISKYTRKMVKTTCTLRGQKSCNAFN